MVQYFLPGKLFTCMSSTLANSANYIPQLKVIISKLKAIPVHKLLLKRFSSIRACLHALMSVFNMMECRNHYRGFTMTHTRSLSIATNTSIKEHGKQDISLDFLKVAYVESPPTKPSPTTTFPPTQQSPYLH